VKKILISTLVGLGLVSCGQDRVTEPAMTFIVELTLNDTMDYCMQVNGVKRYCQCEIEDLVGSFPWQEYMDTVDRLAGEENHVERTIERLNGNRRRILRELNCETCILVEAMKLIDASPSPRCVEILAEEMEALEAAIAEEARANVD